jgi:uncharacterized protein YbgA (DUF1722 family)/uncharacterized protein YbbK (DUF523 family)
MTADVRVRIGISACLLGAQVRWDGGHKRDHFLVETLGKHVEWVPVCPEVESGLPTPRNTLRLERAGGRLRMLMPKTGYDHTDAMRAYAAKRVAELAREDLCGYVLKKDSPSCGMGRVKVYGPRGGASRTGRGLFADALVQTCPWLPVEEEDRLSDPYLRHNFVERVFACRRLRDLFASRWRVVDLVRFHTAHKLVLLSHSTTASARLGRLVAGAAGLARNELRARYQEEFMQALAHIATPRKHANVLHHMVGHLRGRLDDSSRRQLLSVIEDYRQGLVPLGVPVTLVAQYVRGCGVEYLAGQIYLAPYPKELMLRNLV